MNLKALFLALLVVFTAAFAVAEDQSTVKMTDYGIYIRTKPTALIDAPNTQTGVVNDKMKYKFTERTLTVPGAVGTSFGYQWTFSAPAGTPPVEFSMRTIHPPTKNPKTGETATIDQYTKEYSPNTTMLRGFTFEEEWEIAPGKWTMQVYLGDKVILEKTFTVVVR